MRGRWFFFYGTLTHDHDNLMTRMVLPLLEGGGTASVRGQLRAVQTAQGWYPALCRGTGMDGGWVKGRLYRAGAGFTPRHLRLLDSYEQFDPSRRARSEYVRRVVRVRTAGGRSLRAEAYCYAKATHRGLRILSRGDFAAHLARHGLKAYLSEA